MPTKEPDINIYIDARTTSGPSETSQFGQFDYKMTFTMASEQDMCPPPGPGGTNLTRDQKIEAGCLIEAGQYVGSMGIQSNNNEFS